MLKKEINHNDIDGNPTTTVAFFNLTKAECMELNIRRDLEVIGASRDRQETMDAFHTILAAAYGVRTGDGDFVKYSKDGAPLYLRFKSTEAYSELFMEIFSDPDYASKFINGILPAEIAKVGTSETLSQSDIPAHMANHPSMQGRRAATPKEVYDGPATPPVPAPISAVPRETEDEMRARLRAEILAEETQPIQNVSGPGVLAGDSQTDSPNDSLI